jgi:drug/metabolite transporter superfamily protein YnfA
MGERTEAFEFLEAAHQERIFLLIFRCVLSAFDNIRFDPRFADLLRWLGSPQVQLPKRSRPKPKPSTRRCHSCPGYHVVGDSKGGGTMRRERALKVLLVLVGLLFSAGIYPLMMFVRQEPALAMMLSVYVTLGIFLLLASRNPSANRSLIAFTAWSSFAHAAVMGVQAFRSLISRGELVGVAALIVIGVALIVLAPAKESVERVSAAVV